MTTSSVQIRAGLVYKRGEPEALEMEAFRTRLAGELGDQSGLYSVPKLAFLDAPGRTLATEFLPGLLNLHQVAFQEEHGREEVFRAAGRALATVHRELQLPADKIVPLPDYLRSSPADEVALHGDFCWSNVCWQPSQGQVILLDWATAPILGRIATHGCRYFDLLWFSWSLFFWTPPRRLLKCRPERLLREFIEGYAELEPRFKWKRYVEYRLAMRSLPSRYWKGKRAAVPSTPQDTFAEFLGWLRWRLFPGLGIAR